MAPQGARDIDAYLRSVAPRLDGLLPDEVIIALLVQGGGGGSWVLHCNGGRVKVRRGLARWPDCTIECELRHLLDVLDGRAEGRNAFLDGRLRLQGDVGLALRLQDVLLTEAASDVVLGS